MDSEIQKRKQLAVQFLQLCIAGRVDEAFQNYLDPNGKHHNPFFPAGFAALRNAMVENHTQFPDKQLTVVNVLGDRDLVAVHSRLIPRLGEISVATVHLFRFRGDRIVEMWDCGQPIPPNSPNQDGAF